MSILLWLLGALGLSGAGIGVAFLLGGGPMLLGIAGKLFGFAKGLSPKTWLYIAGAAALVAAFFIHQHHAHKAIKDAYTAGYNKRADEDAKVLAVLVARARTAEANFARLAQDERTKHDQAVRANASAADALRLRGPGAARCERVVNSSAAAATGGRSGASGTGNAPLAGMPDPGGAGLIAMPFDGTTGFAQQHDNLRDEVIRWHEWYPKFVAEWQKLRTDPVKLEPQALSKHANPGGK